jgi:hypothetical protein
MAIIPSVDALGARPLPQARAPQTYDASGEILAEATGRAADRIGHAVTDFGERRDLFNASKAKAAFIQAESSARLELENDPDWETYETRYREKMSKAKDTVLQGVKIPSNRAALGVDFDSSLDQGAMAVRKAARAREIDVSRADLNSSLDGLRRSALETNDEGLRAKAIDAAQESILTAQANGYVSAQEAEVTRKKWTADYAEAFVEAKPPAERVSMLSKPKGTVADYIDPERRTALLKVATHENRELTVRRESQAQEDAIFAKHGATPDALSVAREIEDPEVRDSTVSRLKVRQAETKQAEIEYRDDLGEQALAFLNGGGKFDDLPLKIKNGLKPSALSSLRSYAEQQVSGMKRLTNPETLVQLSSMAADSPQDFGEADLLTFRAGLSDGDFEKFVDLQRKIRSGNVDGKASGFQGITQVRDVRLRELFGGTTAKGDKQAKINKFVQQFESQLTAFKAENGHPAKADDARKILDDLTAEVAINWGRDKKAFELSDDDIAVPATDRLQIVSELRRRGKPITDQSILTIYKAANK